MNKQKLGQRMYEASIKLQGEAVDWFHQSKRSHKEQLNWWAMRAKKYVERIAELEWLLEEKEEEEKKAKRKR